MSKRLVLVFAVLASFAAAGTITKLGVYHVTLSKPTSMSGTVLKPGDYKLVVGDAKVTITPANGGSAAEAPIKIESAQRKFDETVVIYETNNSKSVIYEIDLGGSKTKLIFAQ
jgi:hypothetical protein